MYIPKYHNKMEKIYSRKRISIPKFKLNKNKDVNKKSKVLIKIIVMLIIEIVVAKNIINAVNPIINTQCVNKAKSIATIVSNEQATVVMENYKYEDLAVIIKDDNGKIQMIKLNIIPVNEIISDVAIKIQEKLNNVENSSFGIRLGSFFGIKLISGVGPNIHIRMSTIGNVETDLKSEFKTAGINQTLHQIYLEINCHVSILTPYDSTTETIKNQVLIAESIIVGEIPQNYYNFEGLDKSSAIDVIE